jgi:hypothetical protein
MLVAVVAQLILHREVFLLVVALVVVAMVALQVQMAALVVQIVAVAVAVELRVMETFTMVEQAEKE